MTLRRFLVTSYVLLIVVTTIVWMAQWAPPTHPAQGYAF